MKTNQPRRIRNLTPEMQERAKELRRAMTPAEQKLWQAVRGKQLGVRVRRQHGVERTIFDFYCPACKLVIEVDGDVHKGRVIEDEIRTEYVAQYGYTVIRFSNNEVLNDLDEVLKRIQKKMKELTQFQHQEKKTITKEPTSP